MTKLVYRSHRSVFIVEKFGLFFFFPFFFQNPPKYYGATRTFRNFLALDCLSVCPSSLLGSLLSKVVG